MHKNSKAFLAIWHDLLDDGKRDWEKWHTYEHMPERLRIPGFLKLAHLIFYKKWF